MLARNAIFIQARIGSSRLPAKIFLTMQNNFSVLQNCVNRAIKISKELNLEKPIIVCPKDDEGLIVGHLKDFFKDIFIFGGSELNVLERFHQAADLHNIEGIVRVTSDNPLFCIEPVSMCLDEFKNIEENHPSIVDLYSIKKLPNGIVVSGFNYSFLNKLISSTPSKETKEHIVIFDHNDGSIHTIAPAIPLSLQDYHCRFCIDDLNDYKKILNLKDEIFNELHFKKLKHFLGAENRSEYGY
tara:strand:- start:20 stop:745 length:726 start_codon:yes stop_codon:yes gene_type:complete